MKWLWPGKFEPSAIQTVSAFEPTALPKVMQSDVVLDRLFSDRRVGMRKAAELVGERLPRRILKGVGVHRVEAEASRLGIDDQLGRIVVAVPRNVQRDARGAARQLLDDCTVVELVENIARLACAGKAGEARAARSHAPARDRHLELRGLLLDLVDLDTAAGEGLAESVILTLQDAEGGFVPLPDEFWVDPRPRHFTPPHRPPARKFGRLCRA